MASTAATTSSTSAPSRRSSPRGSGSAGSPPSPVLEKIGLGKQAADLCTSTLTQYFVREYFGEGSWREYIADLVEIYRTRRDAMLEALQRHFPPQAEWTRPEGGLFVWATLPDYIDTTDLLAKALREEVAFVPGRAAYVDGRGGSSMRLNFSASNEEELNEGIRRIGGVVSEQVALYETITQEHRPAEPEERTSPAATWCPCRGADEGGGPQGRELAGAWGLASLRGSRRGRARGARPRVDRDRRRRDLVGPPLQRPDVVFIALHGPGGEDGTVQELSRSSTSPHRPGVAACALCMDKVRLKHEIEPPGSPRIGPPSTPPPSARWGPPAPSIEIGRASASRWW